jgi:hypothetical protein
MHWRYRLRKQQLLDECDVGAEVFRGGIERLAEFAKPFVECLVRQEQRDHARTYLAGLVSDLKRKTYSGPRKLDHRLSYSGGPAKGV